MNLSRQAKGGGCRQIVAGAAWLVIAASTALGADCWIASPQMCCQSFWIMCEFKQDGQTQKWWCPQLTDTRGMTAKTLVAAKKGVKGKTEVGDPVVVGTCKRTKTKCGEFPGECIVTGVETITCSAVNVQGSNCTGE